jgi:hypothetical protein
MATKEIVMIRKHAKFSLTFLAYLKNLVAPLKPAHDKLVPIKGNLYQ